MLRVRSINGHVDKSGDLRWDWRGRRVVLSQVTFYCPYTDCPGTASTVSGLCFLVMMPYVPSRRLSVAAVGVPLSRR